MPKKANTFLEEEADKVSKLGRPTDYTQDKADEICAGIAGGSSLTSICKDNDLLPSERTVFRWIRTNDDFRHNYEVAMKERNMAHGEQLLDISDDGTNDWMEDQYMKGKSPGWKVNGEAVQRSKLRVDTRKWLMSKMDPKKYGDAMKLQGDENAPLMVAITGMKIISDDETKQ